MQETLSYRVLNPLSSAFVWLFSTDPRQLDANLSECYCLWTQMDPNLSNSPDYNCSSLKWKEWERQEFHLQFQKWNTHFKFNLSNNREECLKHRYFVLFLASNINKAVQASTSDTTWRTDTHTIYCSNSDLRRQKDFTFCYNISYFVPSNFNPTKSYVQKEL